MGLPLFLQLQKYFRVVGFDINEERIAELRKNNDINNEFRDYELKPRNNSLYTHDQRQIKDCNFYIITVPTPVFKNNTPNINYLKLAYIVLDPSHVEKAAPRRLAVRNTKKVGRPRHIGKALNQ